VKRPRERGRWGDGGGKDAVDRTNRRVIELALLAFIILLAVAVTLSVVVFVR
jgi:hypothetical protein